MRLDRLRLRTSLKPSAPHAACVRFLLASGVAPMNTVPTPLPIRSSQGLARPVGLTAPAGSVTTRASV